MGVPYIPVIGLVGTDLLKRRDDMIVAPDPFDGKTMTVVAKLNASHNTNTLNAGQVTIYLGITALGNPQS